MRLVPDTNTVVSGFLWGGNPLRLLEAGRGPGVHLFTSAEIVGELGVVLARPKFAAVLAKAGVDAAGLLRRFSALAQAVASPSIPLPAGLRDTKDAMVLGCARAARADAIVSGDKDLLSMESFEGIPILTARAALEKLGLPVE